MAKRYILMLINKHQTHRHLQQYGIHKYGMLTNLYCNRKPDTGYN